MLNNVFAARCNSCQFPRNCVLCPGCTNLKSKRDQLDLKTILFCAIELSYELDLASLKNKVLSNECSFQNANQRTEEFTFELLL